MRASKACQTNRKRWLARVDLPSSARSDAPYAAARIATVDASETSVVWSNRSAGRLSMKDAPGDDGGDDDDAMVSLVVARGIDLVWFLYFAFGVRVGRVDLCRY